METWEEILELVNTVALAIMALIMRFKKKRV